MEKQVFYQETVPAYGMIAIFLAVAGWMAFSLHYQLNHGPLGSNPAPNAAYAAGIAFVVLIGLNFSAIRIRLTDVDVRASYGVFSKTLSWKEIETCEKDSSPALRYGGWGIRMGILNGKPVTVYNTFGGTRVAFLTRGSKPRGLVVSTRNPEELMRISDQLIRMQRV